MSKVFLDRTSNQMKNVVEWVFLAILLAGQSSAFELRWKLVKIQDCINQSLKLDTIIPSKTKTSETTLITILYLAIVHIAMITSMVFPVGFSHFLHWQNPCKSPLAGYWLIPMCLAGSLRSNMISVLMDFLSQLCVIMANHWLWSFFFHTAVFWCFQYSNSCCHCSPAIYSKVRIYF